MKARERLLIDFLGCDNHYTIPIYQRTYSWTLKQCTKLWEDIEEIANNDSIKYHFIGSMVRIKAKQISQQTIIDGQQRITTFLLLISALVNTTKIKKNADVWRENYLIDTRQEGDLRYKMLLRQHDKNSLIDIMENRLNATLESQRIKENYEFFKEKLSKVEAEKIDTAIQKVIIVDVLLSLDHDNPQLIFERLNSTGLELSQADLIRNYILMGLMPKHQEELYYNYWRAMERDFGQKHYVLFFDRFIRDYLTIKTGRIVNTSDVYETFKDYFTELGGVQNVNDIVADLHKYSEFFVSMVLGKENNIKLKKAFANFNSLKVDVAYPFLLSVYNDFKEQTITQEEFIKILNIIQSYVFRRFICGIATNSLNKTFARLYKLIDRDNYVESVKATFVLMSDYKRFPKDGEFVKYLKEKDLYNTKNRNFWLRRFENHNRKEQVEVEEYTIEHIMPQNLSDEWKLMLGENWQYVYDNYLHTIGNLTLTGYNSELSYKPFLQKKKMEGGFDESPLRLNRSVRAFSVWNEATIKERADILANAVIKIWPYPRVSEDVLNKYKPAVNDKQEAVYTIKDHIFLVEGSMKELFENFRKRVLNIDASVEEKFLKLYVAYKSATNFVDVVPQKSKLRLSLNIDYEEIYDPKNLCIDVSYKGTWGNGNTEVHLVCDEQLEDILDLVKQAFDKNSYG
jgi:uncharacterized protein with ParB-like and HNH nuclease domain/predicted transport protein